MWNLETNQTTQVAAHDAPISSCFFEPTLQCLVTGSWDRTVKFWDCRAPTPVCTHEGVKLERVRAMSSVYPLAAVLCSPSASTGVGTLYLIDLNAPDRMYRSMAPNLYYPATTVCCTLQGDAVLVGGVEGRVAVHYAEEKVDATERFSFKTHRVEPDVFPVNAISVNPAFGSFVTAGSDGSIASWCKDSKVRINFILKHTVHAPPVTATAFNATGELLAYAQCYDWTKGAAAFTGERPHICLHVCNEKEVDPSTVPPNKKGARR